MESPCYRCGTPVEDGSAFCPSCDAPQIKVILPQPPAPESSTPPLSPGIPDVVPPRPLPVNSNQAGEIQWKKYRRLALPLSLLAGVSIAVLAPFGLLFFIASIVFVVGRYCRDHQGFRSASQGAKLGAFNGVVSFVVVSAIQVAFGREEFRQQMMLALQKGFAGNTDPRAQQIMHWAATNQGFAVLTIFLLVFTLVIFLVVSSFTGALTVTFSSNKDRR